MNGCILPGTNIAVDFWKIRNQHCSNLTFFLTHLHGDHTTGLTSSWRQLIYCTEITALLIEKRYGIESRYLRPLEVNSSHMIITDEIKNTTISVTVIEANHCPGAAMFLFEGDFGKILHTGDFRYDPSMFDASSPLSSHIGDIDAVYLDNTFCSPDCVFPRREELREEILQLIRKYPEHDIVIGTRKLGKEDLLVWLAENLQEWISVSGDQFAVAEVLDLPRVFKVQDSECRIRTVPFNMVCKKNMRKWNSERQTVAILPSSIFTGIGGEPFVNQDDVYVVPYSDHSSFAELNEFVSKLKPSKVVPIVSADTKGPFGISLKSRADMSVFDKFCLGTDKRCRSWSSSQPSQINHQSPDSNNSMSKPRLVKARSKPRLKHQVVKGVQFCSEDLESEIDLGKIDGNEKGNVSTLKVVNNCTEKKTGSKSPAHVIDPRVIVIEDEEEDEIPHEGRGGSVTEHPTESQGFGISPMSNPCTEPIDPHKPDVIDPVVIVLEGEDEIPCEDNGGTVTENPTESQMFDISLMSNPCTESIGPHKPDDEDGLKLSLHSKLACHKETDSHKASMETDCNPFINESCNRLDLLHDDGICSTRELHQDKEAFDVTNLSGCGVCRTKTLAENRTSSMRKVDSLSVSPCTAKTSLCSPFGRIKSLTSIPNLNEPSALGSITTGRRTMSLGIIPLTNARNCIGKKRPFEDTQCQAGISGGCQSEVEPSQERHSLKTKAVKETDDSVPRSNADSLDTDSFCSIYTASSTSVEFSAGSCNATLDYTDMVDCDPVAEPVDTRSSASNHRQNSEKSTVLSDEPSPSVQEPSEIASLASVSSNSETKSTIPINETSPSLKEPYNISGPSQATFEAFFQSNSSFSSSATSSESTSAMSKNHKQLEHSCTTDDSNLMDTAQPEPIELPCENTPLVIVSAENKPVDKLSVPGRKRNGSEMESVDVDRNESMSASKKSKMFPFGMSVKPVSKCNEKTSWMRSVVNRLNTHK